MSYSHSNPADSRPAASLSDLKENIRPVIDDTLSSGSLDDESAIRASVTHAIRNCSKSREVIADEMTYLLGTRVTRRSLDSYTSESAELHRFPAQHLRAFCKVTGDWGALRCVIERSGLTVIGEEERALLELGREYLRQKRAAATIAALERKLEGVDLG